MRACFTLIDPRRLQESKVLGNENFQAQVAVADILLGNKSDCCTATDIQRFEAWARREQPDIQSIQVTSQGDFPIEWLDLPRGGQWPSKPHGHQHQGETPAKQWRDLDECGWQQAVNSGEGYHTCGWRIAPATRLDYTLLSALAHDPQWQRLKGFLNTTEGWYAVNALDGIVTTQPIPEQSESRLEIISDQPLDAAALDQLLRECLAVSG